MGLYHNSPKGQWEMGEQYVDKLLIQFGTNLVKGLD